MARNKINRLFFSFAATTLAGMAGAQTQLHVLDGPSTDDVFGRSVVGLGDVNADGKNDFAVGATEDNAVFSLGTGYVTVYSGATATPLYSSIQGDDSGEGFGEGMATADVNNDGVMDVLVGSPWTTTGGRVYAFDGATGTELNRIDSTIASSRFGRALAGVGDVNGDGFDDFLVGAPRADVPNMSGTGTLSLAGRVRLLSGSTFGMLAEYDGAAGEQMGTSVAGLGDVTGDGVPDYAIGSLWNGVRVYSGASMTLLRAHLPTNTDDRYGAALAPVGDVNGDSTPDYAIGAAQPPGAFIAGGTGYVELRSGVNGALIRLLQGTTVGEDFGSSICGGEDLDGDGVPDVVVGAIEANLTSTPNAGFATAFSGADGSTIGTMTGLSDSERFGSAVACLGDTNADGSNEFAVTAPLADPMNRDAAGRVEIFSGAVSGPSCPEPFTFCTSNPNMVGQIGQLAATGTTSIAANDFGLAASQLPPNVNGLFIIGDTPGAVPFFNGVLCLSQNGIVRRMFPSATSNIFGMANFSVDYSNPATPDTVITEGSTWYFQFWHRDFQLAGANLTNAIQVTFCP